MTTMELKAIRMQAEPMTTQGRYQIRNRHGIIVVIDLTPERASYWSQYYAGSTVEEMKS
jgi:hypothetical protein